MLAHAANVSAPLRMARYLAAISRADASTVQEFEHVRFQQEAALRDIADKKEKLAGKRAALQDAAERYDTARKEKTMMLGGLQEEVSADKSTVGKLQATEEQLERLLAPTRPAPPALPEDEVVGPEPAPPAQQAAVQPPAPPAVERLFRAERTAAPFGERKGDLEVPARGRIVGRFGQEPTPGVPAVQGLLVRSEQDRQVVAVGRGEVVFSGPFPGLGSTVIINHGGRFHTVYAHLDSILREVGARVRENEVIGHAGRSPADPALRAARRRAKLTVEDALKAGSWELMANVCDGLGAVFLLRHDPTCSATLLSTAHHLRERIGVAPWPDLQARLKATLDACKESLPANEFDRAWTAGKVYDLSQVSKLVSEGSVATTAPG